MTGFDGMNFDIKLAIAIALVVIGAVVNFFGKSIYSKAKGYEPSEETLFQMKIVGLILVTVGAIIVFIVKKQAI